MGYPNPFLEGIPSREETAKEGGSGARANLIAGFLQTYDNENTRRSYRADLRSFFGGEEAFPEDVREVGLPEVMGYLQTEAEEVGFGTLRRRASTLSKFFKWLRAEDLIEESPFEDVEGPRELARQASAPGQEREEANPSENIESGKRGESEEEGGLGETGEPAEKEAAEDPGVAEPSLPETTAGQSGAGEGKSSEVPAVELPSFEERPPQERPLEESSIEGLPAQERPSQDRFGGPPENEDGRPIGKDDSEENDYEEEGESEEGRAGENDAEEDAGWEAAGEFDTGQPSEGQPGDILQPLIAAGLRSDRDLTSGRGPSPEEARSEDLSSEEAIRKGHSPEKLFPEDLLEVPPWAELDLKISVGWSLRFRDEAFEEGIEVELQSLPGAIVQGLTYLGDPERFPEGAIGRPYYQVMGSSGRWMVTVWRTGREGASGAESILDQLSPSAGGLATRLTFANPLMEAQKEIESSGGEGLENERPSGPSALSGQSEAARLLWVLHGRGWALTDLHYRALREALGVSAGRGGPEPKRGPTKRFEGGGSEGIGLAAPRDETREEVALEVATLLAKGLGLSKTDQVRIGRTTF